MKKNTFWYFGMSLLIFGGVLIHSQGASTHQSIPSVHQDTPLAAPEDSLEQAFERMMQVLTHPRCTNCHPSDNKHLRLGGATNLGVENKQCNTCHQDSNNPYSGVPGAPEWAMAPPSMAWQGLDKYEIARKMMDPSKNGNRSPEDIMHHLTEHELVLWAWEPGIRPDGTEREKPPISKEDYIKAVKEWIAAGAPIPDLDSQKK